jgi:hypothetical protein
MWMNVFSLLLMAATAVILYLRFAGRQDSNWPLFYYAGLILYLYRFDGVFDAGLVYAGVITALVLRFEYLAGYLWAGVRAIESAFLTYVMWRTLGVLRDWW